MSKFGSMQPGETKSTASLLLLFDIKAKALFITFIVTISFLYGIKAR